VAPVVPLLLKLPFGCRNTMGIDVRACCSTFGRTSFAAPQYHGSGVGRNVCTGSLSTDHEEILIEQLVEVLPFRRGEFPLAWKWPSCAYVIQIVEKDPFFMPS